MTEEVIPVTTISWPKVILTVLTIVVVAGAIAASLFWYFYVRQPEEPTATATTKQSTTSAKKATPSAQKDETAGWKKYTNNELKFSFKYPSDWSEAVGHYNDTPDSQGGVTFIASSGNNDHSLSLGVIKYSLPSNASESFSTYPKIKDMAIGESKTIEGIGIFSGGSHTRKTNTTVASLEALKYSVIFKEYSGESRIDAVTFKNVEGSQKMFYIIQVQAWPPVNQNSSEQVRETLLNKLITTFNFL